MLHQQIHNYKITSILGEGGMGTVYLAEHVTIQRKVAIKVLHAQLTKNESLRQRFQNEAVLMAKLQHPNIVGLIDFFEQEGNLFLVMEYVDGIGLDEFIKNLQSPVSIERAKKIMLQVLVGFAYAHSNGIIHRDVKPSNILITKNDEIKILDFGIAKLLNEVQNKLTKTGTQIGTAYYMSPEQVKAQILDQRSDIYSLGVTFYELLSGSCPYANSHSEYEVYRRIVEENLVPLTESLGQEYMNVWRIIKKQTNKVKELRYTSCDEIIFDLENGVYLVDNVQKKDIQQEQATKYEARNDIDLNESSLLRKFLLFFVLPISLVSIIYVLYSKSRPEEKKISLEEKSYELIASYFDDLQDNIYDANDYYAPQVDQFISVKNTTPDNINKLNQNETDFTDRKANIVDNKVNFSRNQNGINYWTFWLDMSCYRVRRQQTQSCKVLIEIGLNEDLKITSYKELDLVDLKFE